MTKILVVDDEARLVAQLKDRLEYTNYEVLTAYDGEEALEKARQERPDLIILDLMMPKMSGSEVCRLLKSDEKYREIPIIILTALAQKGDEALARDAGADEYVAKPFEPEVLLRKVRKLLSTSWAKRMVRGTGRKRGE